MGAEEGSPRLAEGELTDFLNQQVTLSDRVLAQEVAGETVLLDMASEQYFGLDAVGTRIWQLLAEHGDLRRTYDTLLAEYEVGEEQLARPGE